MFALLWKVGGKIKQLVGEIRWVLSVVFACKRPCSQRVFMLTVFVWTTKGHNRLDQWPMENMKNDVYPGCV